MRAYWPTPDIPGVSFERFHLPSLQESRPQARARAVHTRQQASGALVRPERAVDFQASQRVAVDDHVAGAVELLERADRIAGGPGLDGVEVGAGSEAAGVQVVFVGHVSVYPDLAAGSQGCSIGTEIEQYPLQSQKKPGQTGSHALF